MPFCQKHQHAFIRVCSECHVEGGYMSKRPAIGFKPVNMAGTLYRNDKPYIGKARWDGCAPRPPKKGEYYLSGAIETAYRALEDMEADYFIAIPMHPEKP
jgi:hypothetical protein